MKSLAKNSVYNILYQGLNIIFPLVTSIYVSRIIMETGVGKVAYAQNIASYFVTLAALGLPIYGVREIAKVNINRKERSKLFSELFLINALATTLALVLYIWMVVSVNLYRNNLALSVCTGLTILFNYANIDWLYQGQEEYGYITIRSFVVKIFSLGALFVFVKDKNDYVVYALISSLGVGCNYCFNLVHARKYVDLTLHELDLKKHLIQVMVLAVAGFLSGLYNKIDTTMLGIMSTDAVVGYYSNAHKIILLIVGCCTSISAVFMPRLSYYYDNDRKAMNELVSFGTQILIVLVLPATAGVSLLGQDIMVLLYGESFRTAGITLAIFALMLLIRPIGDLLCYQLLISIGQERKRLYSSLLASVVNVILNAILIPIYHQNGAAIASVAAEIMMNGFLLYYVLRYVQIKVSKKFVIKTLAATFVMYMFVSLIKQIVHHIILVILISVLGGGCIYLLCSLLLRNEIVMFFLEQIKKRFA